MSRELSQKEVNKLGALIVLSFLTLAIFTTIGFYQLTTSRDDDLRRAQNQLQKFQEEQCENLKDITNIYQEQYAGIFHSLQIVLAAEPNNLVAREVSKAFKLFPKVPPFTCHLGELVRGHP